MKQTRLCAPAQWIRLINEYSNSKRAVLNCATSTPDPVRPKSYRALKCAQIPARRRLKRRKSSLTHELKHCCLIITCLTNAVIRSHREKQSAASPPPRLFPCFLLGRPLLFARQFENLPACCLPPTPPPYLRPRPLPCGTPSTVGEAQFASLNFKF